MSKSITSVARKLAPFVTVQASYSDSAGKHISIEFENSCAVELSETNSPGTLEIQAFGKMPKAKFTATIEEALAFAMQIAMSRIPNVA